MIRTHLLVIALLLASSCVRADEELPWKAQQNCAIAKKGHEGLNPMALQALVLIAADHRITQTINSATAASNYHGRDLTIDGKDVTSAVDISVRCLEPAAIKRLLSELARNGFAAWYREDGKDSWKGAAHIHAVFAQEPLKPKLREQVSSWLDGRTGLRGNAKYEYWHPTDQERRTVNSMYQASTAPAPR